jgi:hypothetical protein
VLAPFKLHCFFARDPLDCFRRYPERTHHFLIEHPDSAGSDRAHRQLLSAWRTELAHKEYVKIDVQWPRDLVSDRNASPRQCQHDRIGSPRITHKAFCELPSGFVTITEAFRHANLFQVRGAT